MKSVIKIAGFANKYGWSDIDPFEVVRVVSEKCIEVREMEAERDPSGPALQFHVGGFSAHCSNQREQKWQIKSNPANKVVRIRLGKSGQWKSASGSKFNLSDKSIKFYDYNF